MKQHTILAFACNDPGVLNKFLSLVRRKRYNVEALTAGHTHRDGLSRITLTFSHQEGARIEQIVKQIEKIPEVTKVLDVTEEDIVTRELVLLKVRAQAEDRAAVAATADIFGGQVVRLSKEHVIIQLAGAQKKIDDAIEAFTDIGLLGVARTGATAMLHTLEEDLGVCEE